MELFHQTLGDVVDRLGPLPLDRASIIGDQIVRLLSNVSFFH